MGSAVTNGGGMGGEVTGAKGKQQRLKERDRLQNSRVAHEIRDFVLKAVNSTTKREGYCKEEEEEEEGLARTVCRTYARSQMRLGEIRMKRRGEERRTKEKNNGDCETKLGRDLLREGKEDKERETQVKQTNNPSLLDLCVTVLENGRYAQRSAQRQRYDERQTF